MESMISSEIQRVTGFSLKSEVVEYLENFPFTSTSNLLNRGFIYEPREVLDNYLEFVDEGFGERPWPKDLLPIGRTDLGDQHCVRLTDDAAAVVLADFESYGNVEMSIEPLHASFGEWLRSIQKYDASLGEWKDEEEDDEDE